MTLRLALAAFGLVVCTFAALAVARVDGVTAVVVCLVVLALVAAVDLVVVVRRKRRGEPG